MVNCFVFTESPFPPGENVTLQNSAGGVLVQQGQIMSDGIFRVFSFNVTPPVPDEIMCSVYFTEGTATALFSPRYYGKLNVQ